MEYGHNYDRVWKCIVHMTVQSKTTSMTEYDKKTTNEHADGVMRISMRQYENEYTVHMGMCTVWLCESMQMSMRIVSHLLRPEHGEVVVEEGPAILSGHSDATCNRTE